MPSAIDTDEYPLPIPCAVHDSFGPLPGQLFNSPRSNDTLSRFGPRNCDHSLLVEAVRGERSELFREGVGVVGFGFGSGFGLGFGVTFGFDVPVVARILVTNPEVDV